MKFKLLILSAFLFSNQLIAQEKLPHIPLATYDYTESTEELHQLDQYFTDVTIVGLGESTHGTSEFTSMRHRLFRYLVEKHGFNTLFLEEDYATCLKVDAYIKGAEGNVQNIVKSFNQWPWMTQEMADLISWMREYNKSNNDQQLSFVGVDLQYYKTTLNVIDSILIKHSPNLKTELTVSETTDREFMTKSNNDGLEKYKAIVAERKASMDELNLTESDKTKLKHLLRGLSLIIEEKNNLDYGAYRDVKMAENVMAHTEQDITKAIFWANNTHVLKICGNEKKGNCRAGANLKNWMGSKYFSIALDFDQGGFNAYYLSNKAGDKNDITSYTLGEVAVDPAIENSIAHYFRDSYESSVFIPTESFQKRKVRKLAGRFVGASFNNMSKTGQQTYFENWYSKKYDAIILIKNTTPTLLLSHEN
ncbi:erythromycin esterase [Marivirga sericea]|uniref:Erythromycin esterase n=1 Tax=Marivirga sericea TaxID=1028 RepID=A0A1X7K9R9_9BACT|nr:erythromycin esterase family protein [Marivirga sericea]SMG37572.1 erythromycin esterase [Marivirga sericea]